MGDMSYESPCDSDSSGRSIGPPYAELSRQTDKVLETLADRQRRVVLLLLKRGAVENEADLLFRSKDETKAALVHNHLPKLEEAGYIEWDRESGTIEKGPEFDEIEPLLELIEEHSDELPHDWP
jgi:DNA-binding transcriptional ArsR family regulator